MATEGVKADMREERMNNSYEFMNPKGERVLIELTKCENYGGCHALPIVWYRNKFIDHILETYWWADVYVYDADGNCWNKYNPTIMYETRKINFAWMLEATMENAQKLITECIRLAGGEV